MVLDSTRYAIERSARVLRGMTFWGKIRNAFSDDPQVPQSANRTSAGAAGASAGRAERHPYVAGATNATVDDDDDDNRRGYSDNNDDTPVEGFICPDCRKRFYAADSLVAHFGSAHSYAGRGTGGNGHAGDDDDDDDARGGTVGGGRAATTGWGAEDTRIRGGSGVVDGGIGTAGPSLKDQLFGNRGGGTQTDSGREFARGAGAGRGGVIAEQKAVMASQDAYLDSVGQAVKELGLLGRNIGASLDGQGETLDRVAEKTSESNERAAFVTRKAARQVQSSRPKKPTFIMSVALQEVSTGMYLAVTGEEVVLQGTELRNVCRFEAWERQHGIIGLKNSVTQRWLGQTFLGYLRVSGTSYGKNYEWQADLRRKETTMVCCSANWGAGGYLSIRPNNNNNSTRSDGGANCPEPADFAELSLVDATLSNKPRAAVFRVVDCEGYTPQPFVGGRLMRNPGPPSGGGRAGGQPPRISGGEGW
eukprot:g6164.t1